MDVLSCQWKSAPDLCKDFAQRWRSKLAAQDVLLLLAAFLRLASEVEGAAASASGIEPGAKYMVPHRRAAISAFGGKCPPHGALFEVRPAQ
jgi:hypothetical protein